MKKEELIEEILSEVEKHEGAMSRREAMKYMAATPLAATALVGATGSATEAVASDATGKIVIVGGGLAGMSTAAKLSGMLS
ncbi:MAG: NAD(P)/FAD-dependent oxidoreductase, partial [Sulfurimonadaceae bacterium]|nr:NAD(P)/FAD-dependent oxidoreductase [Sulfurimonadaceae bacterium]